MRLRNVTGSDEMIAASEYVVKEPETKKGRWREFFGNSDPVHIEVGMGKGQFIHGMAKENPHINYIGIERYSTVLLRAIQKMKADELPNLLFLCEDAKNITDIFGKGEIDKIYLNFSDPWPKDRHAKRRLPSRQFLERFAQILKDEGKLEFKTDNKELFEFALEELEPAGWAADAVTFDLHQDAEMVKGNIMTEYEEKFSAMGNPIYKYIIHKKMTV